MRAGGRSHGAPVHRLGRPRRGSEAHDAANLNQFIAANQARLRGAARNVGSLQPVYTGALNRGSLVGTQAVSAGGIGRPVPEPIPPRRRAAAQPAPAGCRGPPASEGGRSRPL